MQWPLWLPVLFGAGSAVYFLLPLEPPGWAVPLACLPCIGLRMARLPLWPLLVLLAGFGAAQLRAHAVGAPVIGWFSEATVEGRILDVSDSRSGRPRLLLDDLVMHDWNGGPAPARLRVTLMEAEAERSFLPGSRVMVLTGLMPPGAPVEPGGFDFRRKAWFERIGGIGLARGRVVSAQDAAEPGVFRALWLQVARWRQQIGEGLRAALPGETGSFAAAILVGERDGIPEETQADLRASNLAHLLAISGLHMGLLTGFVFAILRTGLALVPRLALVWQTRRLAAFGAILAGTAYLGLSGAAVATQRSFVMVLVVFGAVMIGRAPISLRGLALAAGVILLLRPESVVEIGFQMSFAATVALVASYDALRRLGRAPRTMGLVGVVCGTALTSLVAGLATAPFAAAAFNQVARYGLLANVLAMPVMAFWVMPLAVLAAALAPLGLAGPVLTALGAGIDVILLIAHRVAGLDGALRYVGEPATGVIMLIALGGLWLSLWRGRVRLLGAPVLLAGLGWWQLSVDRPELIISDSGRQAGIAGPEGRALLSAKRESFATTEWLRSDGEAPDPVAAAARPGFSPREGSGALAPRYVAGAHLGAWEVIVVTAPKPDRAAVSAFCGPHTILVSPALSAPPEGPCLFYNKARLARSGAVAFDLVGEDLRPRAPGRARLWTHPAAGREAEPDQ
ncbi:ComEC/Rec2 family competence protein [Paroceanicella profunda]|uniref:ComEC/Rec2 family competence protein n=1 Tax=Paroceanicella profunda TaxID=2579971 RepID=UPI001478E82B|nr:ComEC/Rec2 family competence protein [Paroceanicella profunda]